MVPLRALLLALVPLATSGQQQAVTRQSIELVVALCDESDAVLETIASKEQALRAKGFGQVRTTYYCKCAERAVCNVRLPNHGREAHTHLTHIIRRYDSLADLTLFINAAITNKDTGAGTYAARVLEWAVDDIAELASQRTASLSTFWTDAHGIFMQRARRRIFGIKDALLPATIAPNLTASSAGCEDDRRAYCASEYRCSLRPYMPCDTRCECEAQHECALQRNRQGPGVPLADAAPPSLIAWACAHWGVPPRVLHACKWQMGGTFAAGSQLLRARGRAAYERVLVQLERTGPTGDMAAQYQERLWRAVLFCSLGGQCPVQRKIPKRHHATAAEAAEPSPTGGTFAPYALVQRGVPVHIMNADHR